MIQGSRLGKRKMTIQRKQPVALALALGAGEGFGEGWLPSVCFDPTVTRPSLDGTRGQFGASPLKSVGCPLPKARVRIARSITRIRVERRQHALCTTPVRFQEGGLSQGGRATGTPRITETLAAEFPKSEE